MSQKFDSVLVNSKDMMLKAQKNKYAVPHININNLEWAKTVLLTAQDAKSPLIIASSVGAAKYMGGYQTVAAMVVALIKELKISVPVALHLDHGPYDDCKAAIAAGYSSVMFDGSHLPFAKNLLETKEIIDLAKQHNVSVEAEVGTIGGEEDGVIAAGEIADVGECVELSKLDISMLAAGIGNVHGPYPENWKGLNFEALEKISKVTRKPIVLHGGSGIPTDQIKKAINLGIAKINVNTELQIAFTEAVVKYVQSGKALDMHHKGYDPRKLLKDACEAMRKTILEKITIFGSQNKA